MRFFVRDGKRSAKKAFLIVMSIMALVVQPLYGVVASQVANAISPSEVFVSNAEEFRGALADSSVTRIDLTQNITTTEEFVLSRSNVLINGADKSITYAGADNLPNHWDGVYVLQVYNAKNVRLNSLQLHGVTLDC